MKIFNTVLILIIAVTNIVSTEACKHEMHTAYVSLNIFQNKFKYRTAYNTNRDLYKCKFVQSTSATNDFLLVIFIRKGDDVNF